MGGFLINLALTAILAFILSRIYERYGHALSNRGIFSRNFMILTMTTMVVITIVKSSLALSLGLVGALSIIRFRTAIKEPEELAYLFFCITIGLGFGADQRAITIVAFLAICVVIIVRRKYYVAEYSQNLYITISSQGENKISLDQIVTLLKKYFSAVDIKRFDEAKEILEVSFVVEFDKFEQLQIAVAELNKLNNSIKITFLDTKGSF